MIDKLSVDAIIFGGGAAGLWLLDELTRVGHHTLLMEAHELGSGQTIASQGILHGGLKYTLSGLFTPSARAVSQMPTIWRRCLAGEMKPDLSNTHMRAEYCHLWRTSSISSRLAMIGARAGLSVAPVALDANERPDPLAHVTGTVARLDEQVIEPASFIADLAQQHFSRIWKIDIDHGLEFVTSKVGEIDVIRLINPESGEPLDIHAQTVVFSAGAGNAVLRKLVGLPEHTMQRRPLHMVMARGASLPALNAHCVDGSATRLTITTTKDYSDRTIWQIGGMIAETGVKMQPDELIDHARTELRIALPQVDLNAIEWATYRVDRAEAATRGRSRPENCFAGIDGNVISTWPTKLVLVPELARRVTAIVNERSKPHATTLKAANPVDWPHPVVALPPWETQLLWFLGD